MSRSFSTTIRAMLSVMWKNTPARPEYNEMIIRSIENHPKLGESAERVELAGDEHVSKADPELRVSGQIFNKDGVRLTSGHWYKDGRVTYSRATFNK